MFALLKNAGFRGLWIAQVVLALGDAFMRMGLIDVFKRCGLDPEAETAKMFFALTLPGLVFGPFAMIHVDRWQRKNVLVISDIIRAVIMMVMTAWLWSALSRPETSSLGVIYMLVFLIGVIVTFYLPARYASMPNLVPDSELIRANTLLTVSMAVMAVGGMPLGGYVAVHFGPLWAVLANTVAYVIAAILIFKMPVRQHATTLTAREGGLRSDAQLKEGLVYLWNHPMVLPLVIVSAVFAFLGGILIVTIVGYANKTLELGTLGLGWLGGAAGVGAGLGVVLLGRGRTWTRSVFLPPILLVLGGGVLFLLSLTRSPWVAAPLLVVLGGLGATSMIPIDAKLQEEVDDERRGAVFAARGMLTSATMLVAFWLKFGTYVLKTTPPPTILWWCGIGSVATAALSYLVMRRRRE